MRKIKRLEPSKDPMGQAVREYYETKKAARLRVFSPDFDEDEIPVDLLFRSEGQMSEMERRALASCEGRILDVGACAGCHTLVLQESGKDVTAIDISACSVEVMRKRGVTDARQMDVFDPAFVETFDTVLMLMNGSGIIGKLENMQCFFQRMRRLLAPGGKILMDSSDLRYVYENEDGSLDLDLNAGYYGELEYEMQYRQVKGEPFDWLYIDFDLLSYYASLSGFQAKCLVEGENNDYLAELRVIPVTSQK